MEYIYNPNSGELYHYGVKGMKWGVRRYQDKSGRLTPAGKKRRRDDWSDDARTAKELRKKKPSQMTNAELRKLNERTRLEQEYSKLHPNAVKKGWKYVAAATGVMGTALAVYNNSNQIIKIAKPVVDKVLDAAGNYVLNEIKM